jgi:hypothetical protein
MKLSETEHEIYVRFNQSNSVWVEFAFVKSEGRFLAFRCNAFCEDPAWENLDAATIEEAKRAVFAWLRRN